MRVYELGNGLNTDKCATVNRELVNKSIFDHATYNNFFLSDCKCDNTKMVDFMTDNPNLHYRDGYGFTNGCVVDSDSAMRYESRITHDKTRIQLCTRWDQAVPDLGKGGLLPNIEDKLKNSEDTSFIRDCDKLSEKNFDRNIPLIGCLAPTIQDSSHIIMPFTRGGDITRNYIHENNYMEKCGFKFNGNFYEKKKN